MGGTVLLVSTYDLGRQPLALATSAAALRRSGRSVVCLDLDVAAFEGIGEATVVAIFASMPTALRIGIATARRIRLESPQAHVVFLGDTAWSSADRLLAEVADAVIGGDAPAALVELVEALASGRRPAIAGVTWRGDRRRPPRFERTPAPDPDRNDLPPLERYARYRAGGATTLVGSLATTRGCRHLCRHCPIPPVFDGRFAAQPVDSILRDVRVLVAAGAGHLSYDDPDFLNGPGHARRVVAAVHREFPHLTFSFTAKVSHLLREPLGWLVERGLTFVVSAVESLSDRVLAELDKGHVRADVERLVGLFRSSGAALRPTFLPFTPWSTLADTRELVAWIAAEDLVDHVDPVQLSVRLLVHDGSLLLRSKSLEPFLDGFDEATMGWRWRHPDPAMDALQADLAAIVAAAALESSPAAATFARIAERAGVALDRRLERSTVVPGLTEAWFC